MKATNLAMFFDELNRQCITFDVSEIEGRNFKDFFGVSGEEINEERTGTFLAVYVTANSLCEDCFIDARDKYLNPCECLKYNSPYCVDGEVVYIIQIEDEK